MTPYYEHPDAGITVYQGDCLEVMPGLAAGCIDMVLADLPYGITQCHWDSTIPLGPLWEQYRRVLKPNGVVVLTACQPFASSLVMSNPDWWRHEWVWIKNRGSNFANTVREPMKEHETVQVFSAGSWTYNPQPQERTGGGIALIGKPIRGQTTPTDNYGRFSGWKTESLAETRTPSSWQKFNTEVGLHPTQKPVPLFDYLIRTYTNPDDTVLDNTMGSGTTLVAALLSRRRAIGIEIDERYCATAAKRLKHPLSYKRDPKPQADAPGQIHLFAEAQ